MELKNVKVMRDKLILATVTLQSVKLQQHRIWHVMFLPLYMFKKPGFLLTLFSETVTLAININTAFLFN